MLTDTSIRAAKPSAKSYKLHDALGLYLLIHPNGGKYFRLDYTINSKRKTQALGVYPAVTLKQARALRDNARELITEGIDPSEHKKQAALAKSESLLNTFEAIAREWGEKKVNGWTHPKQHITKRRLELYLFPHIGNKPIADIKTQDILRCLRLIEQRGIMNTAHRTLQICGQVFRYAVATGRVERDITTDLRGALPTTKAKVFAAITNPQEVGALLRAIDGYVGTFVVKSALPAINNDEGYQCHQKIEFKHQPIPR
jgi:hypothetical protein